MSILIIIFAILYLLVWMLTLSHVGNIATRRNRNYRQGERIRQAIQEHKDEVKKENEIKE